MIAGKRSNGGAVLFVAEPECLPEHMRPYMRELVGLASVDQGKGHATALLHQVCQEADDACMTLLLEVRPSGAGLTLDQLKAWYLKFGFIVIQQKPALMMARQIIKNRIVH